MEKGEGLEFRAEPSHAELCRVPPHAPLPIQITWNKSTHYSCTYKWAFLSLHTGAMTNELLNALCIDFTIDIP